MYVLSRCHVKIFYMYMVSRQQRFHNTVKHFIRKDFNFYFHVNSREHGNAKIKSLPIILF